DVQEIDRLGPQVARERRLGCDLVLIDPKSVDQHFLNLLEDLVACHATSPPEGVMFGRHQGRESRAVGLYKSLAASRSRGPGKWRLTDSIGFCQPCPLPTTIRAGRSVNRPAAAVCCRPSSSIVASPLNSMTPPA